MRAAEHEPSVKSCPRGKAAAPPRLKLNYELGKKHSVA